MKHKTDGESHRERERGGDSLEEALRTARSLPRRGLDRMRERPVATFAAVAGGSFLLGILFASRVVRVALFGVGSYVALQLIRAEIGEDARDAS